MPNMLLILLGIAAVVVIVCVACDPSFRRNKEYDYEEDYEE